VATSVKMSSKNQIVVPSAARKALGLKPGERLLVNIRDDAVIEMRKAQQDPVTLLEGLIPPLAEGDNLWPEACGG